MENEKVLESIAEGQAKEHPILFSTQMVQAILEGRKVQTRRIVKDIPLDWINSGFTLDFVASPENNLCPYGKVGDILWVRETHAIEESPNEYRIVIYKATDPEYPGKWKPSIFLKRKDCRIFLRIESLRIERLQDITVEDSINEGIKFDDDSGYFFAGDAAMAGDAINCFENLWRKINGDESWESNPYVWVISFYRAVGAIDSKTSHKD